MHHLRTLIAAAGLSLAGSAQPQSVPCPGESLVFQVDGTYHGTKTWEFSADGVIWNTVEVIENDPFVLQPEQYGWYRVRFHDETCGIDYVSEAQRFVDHAIDLGGVVTITIGGVVRNELGGPVSGAVVRSGCGDGVSTVTDHFGVFLLQEVESYEGLAHVTVEKEGYFTGSRSFVPGENAEEAISQVHITLLERNLAGTVQSASGGNVWLEEVSISFPANGFVQNGQSYNGPVRVFLNHIDPTSEDLHDQMPGMLMGLMDGEPQLMLSYGMVGVELTDASGQAVQLAEGSLATVHFPLMGAQQSTAPPNIPLWWFDEDLGYWVKEGDAQLEGDYWYVGQTSHFSWWNCDVPSSFVELKGTVFESSTGGILTGARIVVVTENMGSGTIHANTLGEFAGQVPIGQLLTIDVQLPCGPGGAWTTVHEEVAGPFSQPSLISMTATVPWNLVTGTVADCDGLPVVAGYAQVNDVPYFCVDGVFEVLSCAPTITLRNVDASTGNVSDYSTVELAADTTDVGDLITCTPLYGTVTDIDGYTYQTIVIGPQEWMVENLRTSNYNNGDPIPLVTNSIEWNVTDTDGYCFPGGNAANQAVYGKLYNWAAATKPNICPLGWHVPTDAEWMILETTLGMPLAELGNTNYRGEALNVGGKMKTLGHSTAGTGLWSIPNTGATNESGFSGLPGGTRGDNANPSTYLGFGNAGAWWSTSESIADQAWCRALGYSHTGISRYSYNVGVGLCIRCIRD